MPRVFAAGTLSPGETGSARGGGKSDINRRVAGFVGALSPQLADLSLRTGDSMGFPIDRKLGDVKTLALLGLPTVIRGHRAQQVDLMFGLTGDEPLGGGVARIHELFGRQQVFGREGSLDFRQRIFIRASGRGGFHLGD